MRHLSRYAALLALLLLFAGLTYAQAPSTSQETWSPQGRYNGIAVLQPKCYDERDLLQMLQGLNASLASMSMLNQTAIQQALGAVQGSNMSGQAFGVSANFQLPTTTIVNTRTTDSAVAPGGTTPKYPVIIRLSQPKRRPHRRRPPPPCRLSTPASHRRLPCSWARRIPSMNNWRCNIACSTCACS